VRKEMGGQNGILGDSSRNNLRFNRIKKLKDACHIRRLLQGVVRAGGQCTPIPFRIGKKSGRRGKSTPVERCLDHLSFRETDTALVAKVSCRLPKKRALHKERRENVQFLSLRFYLQCQ